jgi:tetratricopeptide (TPR) repeat protein
MPDLRGQVVQGLTQEAYRLSSLGRHEEALSCIYRAFPVAPRSAHIFNTRSMILDALGRHDEALADVQSALSIDPELPDALNNRGIHYARVGRFEAALSCYERSLALDPGQLQTRYNRSTSLLSLGHWLRGFKEFEVRWRLFPLEASRLKSLKPVWLGERDIAGKTILLHHEQGFGDTLQFCRYAVLVQRLGASVIVAVPETLRALMCTLPGRPRIVGEGEPIPEHDYCCSLMSLPHVFCTTPENTWAEVPYLSASAECVGKWSALLGAPGVRPRVGLVWSGRRYPPINYPRDMSIEALSPLLAAEADFVCLQTDLTEAERARLGAAARVVRYGDTFADFADTAGLIENLDVVITVDTAVAHLAGALGKPVWVMNRYASCWRWMMNREDSPWYPSLRLFRQQAMGEWSSVVRSVGESLRQLCAEWRGEHRDRQQLLALLNSGLAHHRSRAFARAIADYRVVLEQVPQQPEALHFLGVALAEEHRHEEALTYLSAAVEVQPDNPAAHNHRGNVLAALARYDEALLSHDRAIALDPNFAEAHYNRGVSLVSMGRTEAAIESYQRALTLQPDHSSAHNNLGNAYVDVRRFEEALGCYERATQLRPAFVDAWVNRANALRRLGRTDEAIAAARTALECEPGRAEAHSALGSALASQGQLGPAMFCYERALELKPGLAEALWNKALAQLSQGEFRAGWVGYEARWKVKSLQLSQRYGEIPPWLGRESVRGKTVLLHAEQGYGDSIQFCRYATVVAAQGARVVLGVPGGLGRLMRSVEGVSEVVMQPPIPEFDFHCPLLSLPLAFETEVESIPAAVPYLRAAPEDRAVWAARLGVRTVPRVGFCWSGSPTHTNDVNRSIPLGVLLPLTRCAAQWVSVQKEVRAGDTALLAGVAGLYRAGELLTDFADTAALVSELDLVITVDTSVAHLAGALGKPVWILLPFVADWRWLREREDSPWYPTARLFRQSVAGDWGSVVERVLGELRRFLRG